MQRYNANGVPQGDNTRVNSSTNGIQKEPAVAMDDAGNYVVVWTSQDDQDGDSGGIYAQRFNSNGVAQGAEIPVNTTTAGYQGNPRVSMDADGDFVVTWVSQPAPRGDPYGVYAQRFNRSGAKQGAEFRVNPATIGFQLNPSVALDAAGNFAIDWHHNDGDSENMNYDVYGIRYYANGQIQFVGQD
jgi:hypothetical protein